MRLYVFEWEFEIEKVVDEVNGNLEYGCNCPCCEKDFTCSLISSGYRCVHDTTLELRARCVAEENARKQILLDNE